MIGRTKETHTYMGGNYVYQYDVRYDGVREVLYMMLKFCISKISNKGDILGVMGPRLH